MAIHKEIRGDELYLWMNGKIIYKRWLKTGHSKVFDIRAYDKKTFLSIVEDDNGKVRKRRKIFIDGNNCNSETDFWNQYKKQISAESAKNFGMNLDAFNDAITGGGPGFPGDCLIEIIGIKELVKLFGSVKFEFVIQLLKEVDFVDLIIEKQEIN